MKLAGTSLANTRLVADFICETWEHAFEPILAHQDGRLTLKQEGVALPLEGWRCVEIAKPSSERDHGDQNDDNQGEQFAACDVGHPLFCFHAARSHVFALELNRSLAG